jgi:hypothetical protein
LTSKAEVEDFKAKHNVAATPQIFFDSERIGGYTDLKAPLGTISFLENAIMIAMGAFLLFSSTVGETAQLKEKAVALEPQRIELLMPSVRE